ncbi:hypothetical protein [Streptomyces sp. NPDC102283]
MRTVTLCMHHRTQDGQLQLGRLHSLPLALDLAEPRHADLFHPPPP